jgi:hypothetical protein
MNNQVKQNFEKISKILKIKIINFEKCKHTKNNMAILDFKVNLKNENLIANIHSVINFDGNFYDLETFVEINDKNTNKSIYKGLLNMELDDDFLDDKKYVSEVKKRIKQNI